MEIAEVHRRTSNTKSKFFFAEEKFSYRMVKRKVLAEIFVNNEQTNEIEFRLSNNETPMDIDIMSENMSKVVLKTKEDSAAAETTMKKRRISKRVPAKKVDVEKVAVKKADGKKVDGKKVPSKGKENIKPSIEKIRNQSTSEMVSDALQKIKNRKGFTLASIRNYILKKYSTKLNKLRQNNMKRFMHDEFEAGRLTMVGFDGDKLNLSKRFAYKPPPKEKNVNTKPKKQVNNGTA